jgi:hypothetical protein
MVQYMQWDAVHEGGNWKKIQYNMLLPHVVLRPSTGLQHGAVLELHATLQTHGVLQPHAIHDSTRATTTSSALKPFSHLEGKAW